MNKTTIPKELRRIKNLHKFDLKQVPFFVYFLVYDNEIVYVGRTSYSPYNRIPAHKSNKTFSKIYYVQTKSLYDAEALESRYISEFKPKYNKQYPIIPSGNKELDKHSNREEIPIETEKPLLSTEEIKDRISSAMQNENKSLRDIAKEINYTFNYLYHIMRGKMIPGRKLAQRIRDWSDGAVGFDDLWK
jgi:hypothetical protein